MNTIDLFPEKLYNRNKNFIQSVPSLKQTHDFINDLIFFLFPIKIHTSHSRDEVELKWHELQIKFKNLLVPIERDLKENVEVLSVDFFSRIPAIYEKLLED